MAKLTKSKGSKSKKQDHTMNSNSSGLIENTPEVTSFIYQQINEFNPYVSTDTVIMVLARDPHEKRTLDEGDEINSEVHFSEYKHRIAIILQEHDATLEAEAYHDNIYEAIKLAKVSLIERLTQIQIEMEEQKDLDFENHSASSQKSESLH